MNYTDAIKKAQEGYTLMLPGWAGYFNWNYADNTLLFNNGDYYLSSSQLDKFNIKDKTNWYYIL